MLGLSSLCIKCGFGTYFKQRKFTVSPFAFRKLNLNGTGVSLKALTKLLNCCPTLESLNLTSCRALPRGMKRMYHNREDVAGLAKDISEGKFDPQDAGSDDDR